MRSTAAVSAPSSVQDECLGGGGRAGQEASDPARGVDDAEVVRDGHGVLAAAGRPQVLGGGDHALHRQGDETLGPGHFEPVTGPEIEMVGHVLVHEEGPLVGPDGVAVEDLELVDPAALVRAQPDHTAQQFVVAADPQGDIAHHPVLDHGDAGDGPGVLGEAGGVAPRHGEVSEAETVVDVLVRRPQVEVGVVVGAENGDAEHHDDRYRRELPLVGQDLASQLGPEDGDAHPCATSPTTRPGPAGHCGCRR